MIVVTSPFLFPSNFSERKRLEWKRRVQEEEQEEGEGGKIGKKGDKGRVDRRE